MDFENGADPSILSFKPDGSVSCLYCHRALIYETLSDADPPIGLNCKPSAHVFCSAFCFLTYCDFLREHGLIKDNDPHCPLCDGEISLEIVQRAEKRRGTVRPMGDIFVVQSAQPKQKKPKKCNECKEKKEVVRFQCGHKLCMDCRVALAEKLKDEEYEQKEGQDPNCWFCRKPESLFFKAKNFATSDTGMGVLKSAGEFGFRTCCSSCATF